MSKYEKLWKYVADRNEDSFVMSFAQLEEITGFPVDHSFLTYKKELNEYGFKVGRISMKAQTVAFERA